MSKNFIKRNLCPCCESSSTKIIHSVCFSDEKIWSFLNSYYEGRLPREMMESDYFNVARCNNCGLLFQEYVLNDSNMYLLYEEWISPEKSRDKKLFADISLYKQCAIEVESICAFIHKKPHEINVLEYGMGWGHWSNMVKAYNYNVTGAEISKRRQAFAQKTNLRVIAETEQEESGTYDYIYSNQVFEHVPDPNVTIKELGRLLRKNGIIHIKVPNGRGLEKDLKNPDWKAKKDAIHPLEHINCFNRKSLKILAKKAGLVLHPPLYRTRGTSTKFIFRRNMKYLYERYWSTKVYMIKM